MARRSHMSILKRQRELKKSEKAARKRARRHGAPEPLFHEPTPTVSSQSLFGSGEDDGTTNATFDENDRDSRKR